jgi:hypothetical protein
MLYPLIALWRHNCRVTFYESGGSASTALFGTSHSSGPDSVMGSRIHFYSHVDAQNYLRFWVGDPAARAELNWMVHRMETSSAGQRGGDDWIEVLANRLFGGGLVAMEESSRLASPGRLIVPGKAAAKAAAVAALPALASVPAVPVVVPLLPALEDLQIETAEVMPEINQSLAKVDLTMASVSSVTASLSPTTAGIADIQKSVDSASSSTTKQLSDL